MRTYAVPVKRSNFEDNELKAKNRKAVKTDRRGSKKMISALLNEDEQIAQDIKNQFKN